MGQHSALNTTAAARTTATAEATAYWPTKETRAGALCKMGSPADCVQVGTTVEHLVPMHPNVRRSPTPLSLALFGVFLSHFAESSLSPISLYI